MGEEASRGRRRQKTGQGQREAEPHGPSESLWAAWKEIKAAGVGRGVGVGVGGLEQGRMSLRDAASTGEGVTPTTAAKLFQPQPKRNTEKGESQRHGGGQSDRREDDCKWPQC